MAQKVMYEKFGDDFLVHFVSKVLPGAHCPPRLGRTLLPKVAGPANGENDYEAEAEEFDPIKHHNTYCPWVNENVAAAGCNSNGASTSSSFEALCGWQLTLDALNAFQSLGDGLNQAVQFESAASLYRDDITPQKLLTRRSFSKNKDKGQQH